MNIYTNTSATATATGLLRKCIKCEQQKTLDNFESIRNVCRICRNEQMRIREAAKKAKEAELAATVGTVSTKKCSKCNQEKAINAFSPGRPECKECRRIKVNQSLHEKLEKRDQEKQAVIETSSMTPIILNSGPCTQCGMAFDPANPDLFKYRTDRQVYAAICKKCYNGKQYYKSYRDKKRDLNKHEYLQQNAIVHKKYADAHPELISQYIVRINTNAETKLKQMRKNANARGIYWCAEDEPLMCEKLKLCCAYCGETSDESDGMVRGLDRIDSNMGYTNANTLPACYTCNMMKGVLSIQTFIQYINKIYEHTATHLPVKELTQSPDDVIQPEPQSRLSMVDNSQIRSRRNLHHEHLVGKRMVFYNMENNKVAHITNTLKEAAIMIGLSSKTAYAKAASKDAIWVKPHWKLREYVDGIDIIDEAEYSQMHAALQTQLGQKYSANKNKIYIETPSGERIPNENIEHAAKALNIDIHTIYPILVMQHHKINDVIIDLTSWGLTNYKLISVVSR